MELDEIERLEPGVPQAVMDEFLQDFRRVALGHVGADLSAALGGDEHLLCS